MSDLFTDTGAIFSRDNRLRYSLWRIWDRKKPACIFVLLNPSTATADSDDPTVAKCGYWARQWNYGALFVLNSFAFRATDPRDLYAAVRKGVDVQGDNDWHIARTLMLAEHPAFIAAAARIVVGWGNHAKLAGRNREMVQLLRAQNCLSRALCLGVNADKSPTHPKYLALATEPRPWHPPAFK